MIPKRLEIEGLYSYKKKQVIEFDHLTNAGLFGIFGATGSGKSSILEAIMYALYGETERLNKSDSRAYNMMNLQSDTLSIDFTFTTGLHSQEFRATVLSKRNKKQFNVVPKTDRSAYKKINEEWIPIECEQLTDAIGLSYQNFKRSIIIPQGKFMDFIHLPPTERTKMLKDIFNLDKYELWDKTGLVEVENEQELNILQGKISQLGEIDAEFISELKKQIEQWERNSILKNKDFENQVKKLEEIEKIKIIHDKIVHTKKELEHLQKTKDSVETNKKILNDTEYCKEHFGNLISDKERIEKSIAELQEELRKSNLQFENHKLASKKIGIEFNAIHEGFIAIPENEKRANKYKQLSSYLQLKSEKIELTNRLAKGKEVISKTQVEQKEQQEKLAIAKEQLQKAKQNKPNLEFMLQIKLRAEQLENAEKEKLKQVAKIEDLKKKILKQSDGLKHACEKVELSSDNWKESLSSKKSELLVELTALKQTKTEFDIKKGLEEFAVKLNEGEECPLCGSIHHPKKAHEILNTENLQNIVIKITNTEKQIELLTATHQDCSQLSKQQEFYELELESLCKELKLKESENNANSTFLNENYPEYGQINIHIENAQKHNATIESLSNSIDKMQSTVEQKQKDIEKFTSGLEGLKNSFQMISGRMEEIVKSLDEIDTASNISSKEAEQEAEAILKNIEDIKLKHQKLSSEKEQIEKSMHELSGKISSVESVLKSQNEERVGVSKKIDDKLLNSKFENLTVVEQILKNKINTDLLRKEIEEYEKKLFLLEQNLNSHTNELNGAVYNEHVHMEQTAIVSQLKNELKDIQNTLTLSREKLKEILDKEILLQQLLKDQKIKLERKVNIQTLKNIFKASGFVNYVSTVYLQNLCAVANERFSRLTNMSLQLELNEKNEFIVRDYLNNGQTRSVKTLSGGQSFQVALSLALALSDSVQKNLNNPKNFFFIDEGFGSQDKESLEIVFKTLKALRTENKIVGVISHVEELKESIDSHITIINKIDEGSIVSY